LKKKIYIGLLYFKHKFFADEMFVNQKQNRDEEKELQQHGIVMNSNGFAVPKPRGLQATLLEANAKFTDLVEAGKKLVAAQRPQNEEILLLSFGKKKEEKEEEKVDFTLEEEKVVQKEKEVVSEEKGSWVFLTEKD
jgi:hypothetical protein